MSNSWPGAREVPDRQAAHGEGDIEAALAILTASRGSQWTEEMEALVEYRLRSNIGPGRTQGDPAPMGRPLVRHLRRPGTSHA